MATHTTLAQPRATIAQRGARLSLAATLLFLVLLLALHVIEPQFAPSWRMVSEYETGNYGWVMQLAFLCLSLSCVALFLAIRSALLTRGGKIGLGFLLASAFGIALAAFFTADPITAPPGAGTIHGMLHGIAAIIGLPTLPIAALLTTRSLLRNPAWERAKRGLLITAHATWVSLAVMIALVAVQLPHAGGFGPTVWVGWTNRLVMVVYSGWLLTAAWYALQTSKQRS
jgi:hypothetical protein